MSILVKQSLSKNFSILTKLVILLVMFLQGCATTSTLCGIATTTKLVMLHSPWAIVPAIYTIGTMKKEKNLGDAILECGGTTITFWK